MKSINHRSATRMDKSGKNARGMRAALATTSAKHRQNRQQQETLDVGKNEDRA
jgi:hypothetical protein